uniref:Reverse transcriptase Ty1/copia-type domain-containing protein n=1 Tax=Amphimedon queenslandica TaxID=400682 RepID=A0A1X7UFM2_AMPQE
MSDATATKTPVNPGVKLSKGTEDSELIDADLYQSAVGKLLYLSTRTQPDISFAVPSVARYTAKPTSEHWKAVKHIFRYLVGTVDFGLLYSRTSSICVGFSDSDWGGDLDGRKSTSGYVFQIGGGRTSKLAESKAILCGLINIRGKIHCINICSSRSYLASTLVIRSRTGTREEDCNL